MAEINATAIPQQPHDNIVTTYISYVSGVCCRKSHTVLHESGNRTYCTRTAHFTNDEERELCIKQLKCWLAAADEFDDKIGHQKMPELSALQLPEDELIENSKEDSDREFTDEELRPGRFPTAVQQHPAWLPQACHGIPAATPLRD